MYLAKIVYRILEKYEKCVIPAFGLLFLFNLINIRFPDIIFPQGILLINYYTV